MLVGEVLQHKRFTPRSTQSPAQLSRARCSPAALLWHSGSLPGAGAQSRGGERTWRKCSAPALSSSSWARWKLFLTLAIPHPALVSSHQAWSEPYSPTRSCRSGRAGKHTATTS